MSDSHTKDIQIILCPHCSHKSPHEVISTAGDIPDFRSEHFESVAYYFFVQCQTCSSVSVYYKLDDDFNPEEPEEFSDLNTAFLLYPNLEEFHGAPTHLVNEYNGAKKLLKLSPDAFAVKIGRALEYLCNDKSAEGRDLKGKLDDLARRNIIPTTLSDVAKQIRIIRNFSAHASGVDISRDEAQILDELFCAVMEYVYEIPEKLNRLVTNLEKLKKSK